MNYIEKEKLIKADIASIENRVRHAFNQGYDLGFKDGKEKAKPLEQEPKKGHWIPYLKEGLIVKCSECKSRYTLGYNYCPNCGADMQEVEE